VNSQKPVTGIFEHMDMLMPQVHGCRGAAHSPKNLPKDKLAEVETELADAFICLIRPADKFGID
jgi:hypothetical protein